MVYWVVTAMDESGRPSWKWPLFNLVLFTVLPGVGMIHLQTRYGVHWIHALEYTMIVTFVVWRVFIYELRRVVEDGRK